MTEAELAAWTGPSSTTEQEKQDRTERMVQAAIASHKAFEGVSLKVYTKGSYPNNTNVRTESDVDVAVQCQDCIYFDGAHPPLDAYTGTWTPRRLRTEVGAALESKFPGAVDSSGKMAFRVRSSSARVDADVVACFDYRYYFDSSSFREGSRIFRKDDTWVNNFATQQLEKGRAKNNRTGTNYKKTVRIAKRAALADTDSSPRHDWPSFFIESLVYNCPDAVFTRSTWTDRLRGVLVYIWESLDGNEPSLSSQRWLEANECKYLFANAQPWSRADARAFAKAAWSQLGLNGE